MDRGAFGRPVGPVPLATPATIGRTPPGQGLDELNMPTNFGLLKAPWTAAGIRRVVDHHKPIPASSSDETTGMAPFFVATRAA